MVSAAAVFGGDTLAHLEPLCGECHLRATLGLLVPADTLSPAARAMYERLATEYETRVKAPEPLRPCDDPDRWPSVWRTMRAERTHRRTTP